MLVIGIVLMVLTLACGGVAVAGGVYLGQHSAREVPAATAAGSGDDIVLTEMRLQPGQDYAVATFMQTIPLSDIAIYLGEPGSSDQIRPEPATDNRVSIGNMSHRIAATFRVPQPGIYSVVVQGHPGAVVQVASYTPAEQLAVPIIGLVLGIIGVIVLGAPGLGLTIGGAVWRSRRKRNARVAPQTF